LLNQAVIGEDVLETIFGKLANSGKCRIVTIPRGAVYIDQDVTLSAAALTQYEQAKLYVTGTLRLESDVTPEALRRAFAGLHTNRMVVCRSELNEAVLELSDSPNVPIFEYSGKLLIIDGEYKLTASELKYTGEAIAFLVNGVLDISDKIDPDALFEKTEKIANYGIIVGSGEHCGVVRSKLHINKGVINNRDEEENDEDASHSLDDDVSGEDGQTIYIKNMNYLKL